METILVTYRRLMQLLISKDPFGPELITDIPEPVNSVTMKVLQPLWNLMQ